MLIQILMFFFKVQNMSKWIPKHKLKKFVFDNEIQIFSGTISSPALVNIVLLHNLIISWQIILMIAHLYL